MFSSLSTLLLGIVFGLALAAPPGPMNAIIAEESVLRGWVAGFRAGLGAMLADVCFFLLTLAGVAAIVVRQPAIEDVLFVFGGALMLLFAVDAVRSGLSSNTFTSGERTATSTGFRKTFVLSLTNPYQLSFWLTVGVGLVRPGTVELAEHVPTGVASLVGDLVVQTGSPALLVGFFAGIGCWTVVYPAGLVTAGRRVDTVAPAVAITSAIVLAGFGVAFCWIGATALL